LDVSDVYAEGDVTNISAGNAGEALYISDKAQLNDDVRKATRKLATLEKDRFKLNGEYSFPDPVVANNGNVGYASDWLSDENGSTAYKSTSDGSTLYYRLTFDFGSTHTSPGVTVTFNPEENEYATEFIVYASVGIGRGGTSLDIIHVYDNAQVTVDVQGNFVGYDHIFIDIVKWSKPNRRVRVQEVDFGVVKVYDGETLISCNLTEEFDMTSGTVPSPEFRFTVDNLDRRFNILNPTGFAKYLQQRQTVIAELGVEKDNGEIEYMELGKYLLWEWTSEEGSMTATFTARTNLDLMDNYLYEKLTPTTKTLYQLAQDIFAGCGITTYSLDVSLQGITTNSMTKEVDCKTAIQMIAIAGCCNIFVDRGNIITLKKMTPIVTPDDRIDLDNVYVEPKIELEKVVRRVDVTYWSDMSTSGIATVTDPKVDIGDTLGLQGNTFINTISQAQAVATWLLAQKAYRNKYSINWRGNPAQELLDGVGIESTYGVSDMNAFITKQTLDFQGYLAVQTEAKGLPN
jgi:hypothetical protein